MRTLVALRWPSSGRQILLSFVVAVILVFGTIALLKVNSGAKQAATTELLTGSIPTSLPFASPHPTIQWLRSLP
jgi:hypothetical protein